MRVVVVGTSGAGKTVMAKSIASALNLACIELDRLHWEPHWEALTKTNPDEFVRRVSAAISADAWVSDGNYGVVRNLIWRRATHLVWLDYDRVVVMYRVIKRSIARALDQEELWPETEKTGATGCDRATQSDGPGVRGRNGAYALRNS
jgi:adenylate kinase family enzyme